MALHFVLDEPTGAGPGDTVVLTGSEAHHAASVRRVRVGEEVTVGDGRGAWLTGRCESVAPREVVVRVESRTDAAAPRPRVVLVQALAKGDRDELAVQAATELGIDEIVPWQASRSVSRWDAAKAEKGRARWATIVREAAKQAHRAWIPEVSPLVTTRELLRRVAASRTLVLEPTGSARLTGVDLTGEESDVLLVVGPEGGIAPDELAELETSGAVLVRLGESVLRTSTAGPAALAVVSASLGRW
ncbi:16S rRNA (uracil(1498)-N(3))-methyltransferase [Microbacterium sp. CFH 31415]|uniref:16S rRNA (uracil(1498)-N(3))-methyltransferase n=1 Tax=Microbacterium sp. CFH 31415 TaxID=2921732 RepID=UPI001F12FFF5|nr:16S rRNA (uracil(1498)-N(3))-methyltransferase [Microbacterium sp. CFH 31415]MCH6229698.1 16S rRNA (uracil(1498)-N(3))-methyltransferase [Microbacterium sp. CFH 31415]